MDSKNSTIGILTYHSIDSSGSVISTAPQEFRNQMNFLARSGYRSLSLREVVERVKGKNLFPEKSVVLTFDDGFTNFFDLAFPVLKECGFTATVFPVTGYCGRSNQWKGQPEGIPVLDLMTWDQIARLSEEGIEFGAHTVHHADLTRISPGEAMEEMVECKERLEESLGKKVDFFAHPYGKTTAAIQEIVRRKFLGACSTKLDFVRPQSDPFFLPRIDMYYFSKNRLFPRIGTPRFVRYVRYRGLLRSVRQRIQGLNRT